MIKVIVQILFIVTFFLNNHSLRAEQVITLFLKPYPVVSIEAASKKLAQKFNKPGKVATNRSKHILPAQVSGIFATYAGFLTVSNYDGQISFVRKHSKPFIYFLVTERFTPILRSGNTIDHWELEEGIPARMYKMEQIEDSDSHMPIWQVTQEPLPANNIIPLESMVLIADPKYVYVPVGISLYKASPHLLLPDVYIKKGINLTQNALYIVNLTHYFGSIIPIYKMEKVRYSRHLTY